MCRTTDGPQESNDPPAHAEREADAMSQRFDLQGHRGARGLFPENTVEGFRRALAIGVDTFELDVAVTSDGVAVVSHDAVLNPDITRTADGEWLEGPGPVIHDLPVGTLATYDVGRIRPGSAYASRFPDQAPIDGARIPALETVLRFDRAVRWNVELKLYPDRRRQTPSPETMVEIVLETCVRSASVGRMHAESFDWRAQRHFRRLRPELPLAWLTEPATVADARSWWGGPHPSDFGGSVPRAVAAEAGTTPGATWAPDYLSLGEDAVAEAHGLGLRVVPWTVNDPPAMDRLIAWGVDGLITDRPDLAHAALRRAGITPPAGRTAEPVG
jgi:glycerophosphoryl diester phosphodiesterase